MESRSIFKNNRFSAQKQLFFPINDSLTQFNRREGKEGAEGAELLIIFVHYADNLRTPVPGWRLDFCKKQRFD